MRQVFHRSSVLLAVAVLSAVCVSFVCADTTIVVTPDNYESLGWKISATRGGIPDPAQKSIAVFTQGAASPPAGLGSFYMKTFYWDADPLPQIFFGTNNHSGIELNRITSFKYYTYLRSRDYYGQSGTGTPWGQPPMIELITDSGTSLQQRRFWYKPYGAIGQNNNAMNTWQEWDLMAPDGRWELMNTSSSNYYGNWDWVKTRYTGAMKIATPKVGEYDTPLDPVTLQMSNKTGTSISIKIGSGKAQDNRYGSWWKESCAIEAFTDKLVIGIDGVETVYDFESPKPVVYTSMKSLTDEVAASGRTNYFYAVAGHVTGDLYDPNFFSISDGSGIVKVVAELHTVPYPSYWPTPFIRAWGRLDNSVNPPVLYSRPEYLWEIPQP